MRCGYGAPGGRKETREERDNERERPNGARDIKQAHAHTHINIKRYISSDNLPRDIKEETLNIKHRRVPGSLGVLVIKGGQGRRQGRKNPRKTTLEPSQNQTEPIGTERLAAYKAATATHRAD